MRYITGLVLLCLIYISAVAQVPTEKTLLWEITGKGIVNPSYLYGTIHLMCPEDIIVHDKVATAFNNTNTLFLEIDLSDEGLMEKALTGMQMNDSSTLEKLLGSNFEQANKAFTKISGMPLSMLNKLKPMMLVSMLMPAMIGCMPDSWEKTFQTMAEKRKMPVKGLETFKDQMDVFDKIPYKEQADIFSKTLLNMDSAKNELQKMLAVYKQNDIEQMHIMSAKDNNLENFEAILLTNRNNKWIPVIENQMKQESTFFACGAGHLGGENGVIDLLRKKGYTVQPVMY